jgi:predicted Zn-dependent peptidase
VFQFVTPGNILSNYMDVAYNRLPPDFLSTYLGHINGVTEKDVLAESRRLFGNGVVTVVVGNETVMKDLKKYGDVVIINKK